MIDSLRNHWGNVLGEFFIPSPLMGEGKGEGILCMKD
jgi:hypothetical protein